MPLLDIDPPLTTTKCNVNFNYSLCISAHDTVSSAEIRKLPEFGIYSTKAKGMLPYSNIPGLALPGNIIDCLLIDGSQTHEAINLLLVSD